METVGQASTGVMTSTTSGVFTSLKQSSNANMTWHNYYDSAGICGTGYDSPGAKADGSLVASVPGSNGVAGGVGGWTLVWGMPSISSTVSAGGFGAALNEAGTQVVGGVHLSSTTRQNVAYVLDLVSLTGSTTFLQGYARETAGTGSYTLGGTVSAGDYSGSPSRMYALWAAVASGVTVPATTALPTPQTSYNALSSITAALLNGTSGVGGFCNFMNNPPIVRIAALLSTSIPDSTVTTVPLGNNVSVDNYGGYASGTSTYTVQRTGVYLVHGSVNFASNNSGVRTCSILVNALDIFGPGHTAPGAGISGGQVTRLLDLQAGDTLKLRIYQTSGAALALNVGVPARLIAVWMGALSTTSGLTWTPPDVGFRWQAGTPAQQLPSLFQQHLANDMNFLINKPYFMGYQTTGQSGLVSGTWTAIQMQNVGGRIHGASFSGDNYNGWTSGAANHYTAPVTGWYLVQGGYTTSAAVTLPMSIIGGVNQFPVGAVTPDAYQRIRTNSNVTLAGAEALGLYYLRAGDTVAPYANTQDGGAWGTSVATAGQESSFGVIWVCE